MLDNLVLNGCFNDGLSHWRCTNTTVKVDEDEGNYAHQEYMSSMLIQQIDTVFCNNQQYQLTLKARASNAITIRPVLVLKSDNTYIDIPCNNPDKNHLTSTWREYKFIFSLNDVGDNITSSLLFIVNFSDITDISLIKC
ncbi:carbohydrate binding domain-containing protein [Photobacterium leiognathi]|uniref:carbohydrate binding domain-containing protein n=1 Tax=Photobacterium leiognathi TaxID=553611 RepID=UPI0029817156|nr:carbohydrate binding domain-containing protein [Photobacterium leiognathi]